MCAMRPITDSKNATKKFIYTFLYVRTYVRTYYVDMLAFAIIKVRCNEFISGSASQHSQCVWTRHESESLLAACLFVWLFDFGLFCFSSALDILYYTRILHRVY